jgi:hypothetical protein
MSITIKDPSLPANVDGLSINIFRKTMDYPQVSIGSIVQCYILVQHFNGRLQGIIKKTNINYTNDGILLPSFEILSETSTYALDTYLTLSKWSPTSLPKKQRQLLFISDMSVGIHCDCQVQIVEQWGVGNLGQVFFGVSDYTTHALLDTHLDYELEEPDLLQYIIVLVCWDENALFAKTLKQGDFVSLENVRPKTDRKGRLELYLHGDRQPQGPPKPLIKKLTASEAIAIKERRALLKPHDFFNKRKRESTLTIMYSNIMQQRHLSTNLNN